MLIQFVKDPAHLGLYCCLSTRNEKYCNLGNLGGSKLSTAHTWLHRMFWFHRFASVSISCHVPLKLEKLWVMTFCGLSSLLAFGLIDVDKYWRSSKMAAK